MAGETGLRVDGKRYEIPSSLRIGETRMIKKITGLNPPEFMQAVAELETTQDPDVGIALVWWVVHRENPAVTLDDLDDLDWSQIEGEPGDQPAAAADPKAGGAQSASSPISASESKPLAVVNG